MKPANTIFILSDEHNKRVLGCNGHPMIKTPKLPGVMCMYIAAGTTPLPITANSLRGAIA